MQNIIYRDKGILIWLASGCILIFIMVIVGGITRLTGSGLSITEWKVVTGTIPPLSREAWEAEFEKYKLIPQYKLINAHFTIEDFKSIYWWEYIHRLIGRLIGLVFIIPYIWFRMKKRITRELMPRLLVMFFLGALQGFIGWYMVSSGLTENVRVSHLRLALHLATAFITFGYIFYVLLQEYHKPVSVKGRAVVPLVMLLLVFVQIIFGAFVAGTHAGYAYNTWPKMEGEWIPESVSFAMEHDGAVSLVNNLASVQFMHRNIAYLITVIIAGWWLWQRNRVTPSLWKSVHLLFFVVMLQVVLGIFTLLAHVPLWMGVAHQAMAFVLFTVAIWHYFVFRHGAVLINKA